MSIDHGKVLALAEAMPPRPMPGSYADQHGYVLSPLALRTLHERFDALAQPAEAVDTVTAEHIEGCPLTGTPNSISSCACALPTDAAQGAVATHENIGRIIGAARSRIESANECHGNQWKQGGRTAINFIEKRLHRLFNRPSEKDTHPQAAPAQGDVGDDDVRAWAERHGLDGWSLTDARCAFDDARTAAPSPEPRS